MPKTSTWQSGSEHGEGAGVVALARREGEILAIGEDVRIHVQSAQGGVTMLSIETCPTGRIRRAELRPDDPGVS